MSITEIKTIVSQLPPADLAEFAEWFEEPRRTLGIGRLRPMLRLGFEAVF